MKENKLKTFIEIIGPVLASFGGMCFGFGIVRLFDTEINLATLPIFISGIVLIITDIILLRFFFIYCLLLISCLEKTEQFKKENK